MIRRLVAAAVVLLAVHGGDRGLGLVVARHFDEPEALAAARVAVVDDLGAGDLAVLAEQLFEVRAGDAVAQIPHVKLLTHFGLR